MSSEQSARETSSTYAHADLSATTQTDAAPRILDSFVRFGERPHHPIRHRSEVEAMLLELFDKPISFVHARALSPSL